MRESEYWDEVKLLSNEIEDAIALYHIADEVNRLAVGDKDVLRSLKNDSYFWRAFRYAFQTSFFIVLGRIFDHGPDAHSVYKILNATRENFNWFSKESLAARRFGANPKPIWMDDFIRNAWEPPDRKSLKDIGKNLAVYTKKVEQVYRPIRDSVFAHRLMTNEEAFTRLFSKTDRAQTSQMLDHLHELILAIQDLYLNGTKPDLGKRDFTEYNLKVRNSAREFFQSLIGRSLEPWDPTDSK